MYGISSEIDTTRPPSFFSIFIRPFPRPLYIPDSVPAVEEDVEIFIRAPARTDDLVVLQVLGPEGAVWLLVARAFLRYRTNDGQEVNGECGIFLLLGDVSSFFKTGQFCLLLCYFAVVSIERSPPQTPVSAECCIWTMAGKSELSLSHV